MQHLPVQPDKTPTQLFNPGMEEFTFPYDGGREVYTLYPLSYDTFPAYIAHKMAPILAEKIMAKEGIKDNFELDKKRLIARILV